MQKPFATVLTLISGVSLLAGCSSDGSSLLPSSLTTSSLSTNSATQTSSTTPRVDPACVGLSQRIEALRRDGVIDRAEKASVGKTTTVAVKRASLAQIAELDKANAEFQSRCSSVPIQTQAQVVPITAVPAGKTASAQPPVVQVPKQ
jgi:hypothetical protein